MDGFTAFLKRVFASSGRAAATSAVRERPRSLLRESESLSVSASACEWASALLRDVGDKL